MAKKNWIQGAIKNPGGLHKALGISPSKKIPLAKINKAAGRHGHLGQMARLAKTLAKLKK